jgi:hypothetical protein
MWFTNPGPHKIGASSLQTATPNCRSAPLMTTCKMMHKYSDLSAPSHRQMRAAGLQGSDFEQGMRIGAM